MENEDSKDEGPGSIYKLFGVKNTYKTPKDCILNLTHQAEKEGALSGYQSKMIEKTLNLDFVTVSDIMTHRVDIEAVDSNAKIKDIIELSIKSGFSRIPVYENDIDNITGFVYVKDLLSFIFERKSVDEKISSKYIRNFLFVTESMKCVDLVKQLTSGHKHLAVVVDEYGGTSGIVSLEDAVEAVHEDLEAYREELTNRSNGAKELAIPQCATGIKAAAHYGIENQWTEKLFELLKSLDENNETLNTKIEKFDPSTLFSDPAYFKTKARLEQIAKSEVMTPEEQITARRRFCLDIFFHGFHGR